MSNSNSSVIHNTNSKVKSRKGARYYFDQITRNIIRFEMIVLMASLLYCAITAIVTFVF